MDDVDIMDKLDDSLSYSFRRNVVHTDFEIGLILTFY